MSTGQDSDLGARSGDAPRVLVTDIEERSALAACRGLAHAGYRVTGAARMRPASGHWSRSCERRVNLPDPREHPEGFVDELEDTLRRDRHEILLPSTDLTTWLISEHRDRFEGLVQLPFRDRQAVRQSLDKVKLIELAESADLGAPLSLVCSDEGEGAAAARNLGFPVVVKPTRSFVRDGSGYAARAVALAVDEQTLNGVLRDFPRPFIVQRFHEDGVVVSCGGLMIAERVIAAAVVRWLRRWPVSTGAATFCETVVPPTGLLPKIERLLASIRFQGIFELELLDLGNGRFSAIDLNPRPFGWMALPVRSGANLPALLCDSLWGLEPVPALVAPGARYRWEDGELRHFAWQLRRGRIAHAVAVLRPQRRVVHAHFQLSDPAPLAARAAYVARLWLRRRITKRKLAHTDDRLVDDGAPSRIPAAR